MQPLDPKIYEALKDATPTVKYYFLLPQQKKVKEHKAMVEGLKRGDKVVTSGGITGRVERLIDNDKVEVEIAENVKVEIVKATGIQSLLNNSPEVKK